MKTKMMAAFFLAMMAVACSAQESTKWDNWQWLIGEWIGEGSGKPGQGEGVFTFKLDLDGNILVRKNHAEYPGTKDRPKAIHDDLMVVYPQATKNGWKAIYFDNEGHVINYFVALSESSIVFTSEKAAKTPVFRLSYTKIDGNSVNVKFEMSKDGVNFTTYIEGKSVRKK